MKFPVHGQTSNKGVFLISLSISDKQIAYNMAKAEITLFGRDVWNPNWETRHSLCGIPVTRMYMGLHPSTLFVVQTTAQLAWPPCLGMFQVEVIPTTE